MSNQSDVTLKQICKLAGGTWAILLLPGKTAVEIILTYGLQKASRKAVDAWLQDERFVHWVFESGKRGNVRQRKILKKFEILGERVYSVSSDHNSVVMLLGCQSALTPAQKDILKLGANALRPNTNDLVLALTEMTTGQYEVSEALKRVKQWLRRIFPIDRGYILFLDDQRECLHSYDKNEPLEFALTGTLEGSVVQIGETVRIDNVAKQSKYAAANEATLAKLVAPMLFSGKVVGVLSLESETSGVFTEEHEILLYLVATHVAALYQSIVLENESRKQYDNLQRINDLFQQIVGLNDVAQIAQRAAELIEEKFDYDLVMAMLLDAGAGELVSEGIAGEGKNSIPVNLRVAKTFGFPGKVLSTGKGLIVRDAAQNTTAEMLSGWDGGSVVCVPLGDGKQMFGVLNVENREANSLDDGDELILQALAGGISSMMLYARRNSQLELNIRQLQAVRETALDISGDIDFETLLKRVVERLRELLDAEGAEIAMVEKEAQQVRILVSDNPWRDYSGSTFPFMSGVAGRVAAMGESLVIEDYHLWSGQEDETRKVKFRSVATVPLRVSDEVIGVLSVQDSRPDRIFDQQDVNMLEMLASQVAILIRNARLYQELEERIKSQEFAEARMLQSEKLAVVGELAAGVAHELNNPLTTVSGFSELVLESLPEEFSQSREDLKLVVQEARRARGVVRRLLDFSRQEEFLRAEADINEVLGSVLALIHHQATTNKVDIRVAFWDGLPKVGVDRNQMQQVFLNLVHNAIQSLPDGGQIIARTQNAKRDDVEYVTVSVEDNGVGIKPENLEKLFKPFFTTKPAGKGTGLGLSVSYRIVAEHGGFIDVDSVEGKGSTFTVWLPVSEEEEPETEDEQD